MRVLIKLGGTLLDSPESLHRLASEITAAVAGGVEAVVVHGGGKQMTRFLAERGVDSKFINGLRVTTPEIIDAVVKVFAGSVNTQLVAAFRRAGARPVGLTGLDAGLVDAEVLNPELGQVGRPVQSDAGILRVLVDADYLPVIACIAGDRDGNIFNVNADQMASACAAALSAYKLLFLTDVEGVRGHGGTVKTLTVAEARDLIESGVASGGMRAKLESAIKALESGIKEVIVAPGAMPGAVASLLSGTRIGTRLIP